MLVPRSGSLFINADILPFGAPFTVWFVLGNRSSNDTDPFGYRLVMNAMVALVERSRLYDDCVHRMQRGMWFRRDDRSNRFSSMQ